MARYHGKKARVLLAPAAASTATPVAAQANWKLSAKAGRATVTSFGDSNEVRVVGLPDFSGSFNGFFDDSDNTLFAAAATLAGVPCYLYPDFVNAPSKYWYGLANVDYEIEADINDAVKISASWDAAGNWGRY